MLIWRRSYDVPPPGGESLKDTAARALPYYRRRNRAAGRGRRDRAGRRARQFAAGAGDGDRGPDAGADPQARTRHRRADGLPASTPTERSKLVGKRFVERSEARPAAPDHPGFPAEDGALARHAPVVAGERAVRCRPRGGRARRSEIGFLPTAAPTAREAVGRPIWLATSLIGGRLADRDLQQRLPDLDLEIGADQHDAHRLVGRPARRIEDLRTSGAMRGIVAREAGIGPAIGQVLEGLLDRGLLVGKAEARTCRIRWR